MISKIKFKCFQINLMLDVFTVEIIKINFKFLFISSNILQVFFCFLHFSLNLHYCFPFFSQQKLLS